MANMALVAFCFSCTFLILELIIPGVIYLNLAIAMLVTGVALLLTTYMAIIVPIFIVSLATSFAIVRPRILSLEMKRKCQDRVKAQYIGKIAQLVEKTDKNSGLLTIDNERWQARTMHDETLEQGESVKIANYKDIVMYVERV